MTSYVDVVLTLVFSALILLHASWITILLLRKKEEYSKEQPSVSVIIPAHNEEASIEKTIESALTADYGGGMEVVVVNDGSTDKTEEKARACAKKDGRVKVINTLHAGKANAINLGAKNSGNEIIVTIDADSQLKKDALEQLVKNFSSEKIGGVSGIIRAERNNNPLTWFQDFEYIQSSTWRLICSKINATYIFPGFAAFRRKAFIKIGGFSSDTYSEDLDIGLRLKKEGYGLRMSRAVMYTKVPETLKGLIKQRTRWGRGTMQVMKKHRDMILNKRYGTIAFYGMPTQIYWYIHGIVYIPILLYQVSEGYYTYFASRNIYLSIDVANFLLSWFTAYGMLNYIKNALTGAIDITLLSGLMIIMFVLYLIYNTTIISRYAGLGFRHLFVLFFFFPYSMLALVLQIYPVAEEIHKPKKSNIWEKSQ